MNKARVAFVFLVLLIVTVFVACFAIHDANKEKPRLATLGTDWVLYGVGHPDCPIDTHKLDIQVDEREPNQLVISCTSRDKE